jgi:hypothetical protein
VQRVELILTGVLLLAIGMAIGAPTMKPIQFTPSWQLTTEHPLSHDGRRVFTTLAGDPWLPAKNTAKANAFQLIVAMLGLPSARCSSRQFSDSSVMTHGWLRYVSWT